MGRKRQIWPFQCTPPLPTPVPSRNEPRWRIGSASWLDVVADGERVVGDVLEQVVAPHVAQLVLREAGREIGRRVAPRAALQRHARSSPASHSCWPMMAPVQPKPTSTASTGLRVVVMSQLSVQPGRPLKPTVGKGTRSPCRVTHSL